MSVLSFQIQLSRHFNLPHVHAMPQDPLCGGFAQRLLVEEPSSLHAAEGDGVPRGVLPSVCDAFSDSIPDHLQRVSTRLRAAGAL